jgi:hypothetical protein
MAMVFLQINDEDSACCHASRRLSSNDTNNKSQHTDAMQQRAVKQILNMVRGAGLEPAQYCYRQDLNLVRLPISPPAQTKQGSRYNHPWK